MLSIGLWGVPVSGFSIFQVNKSNKSLYWIGFCGVIWKQKSIKVESISRHVYAMNASQTEIFQMPCLLEPEHRVMLTKHEESGEPRERTKLRGKDWLKKHGCFQSPHGQLPCDDSRPWLHIVKTSSKDKAR